MADVAIRAQAVGSAPRDYTIPGAQEILPKSVTASIDGTGAANPYFPCLQVLDPGGNVMFSAVGTTALAAGASADVSWFPHIAPTVSTSVGSGVIVETFFVSSVNSTPHTSTTVLQTGRQYIITVQGTYSLRNVALTSGSPQPDAMFPTSTVGRISTTVGWDAETIFADQAGVTGLPHHTVALEFDLGDGLGLRHIEPVGGPFSSPQQNFFYTYNVTGNGSTIQAVIQDSVYTDNYGELLVTIQTVGGNSGGGGGGSLLPDPTQQPDGSWLVTSSGVAVWNTSKPVTSLDSIHGAVSLVAGSNVTITDNSPGAGQITIAAASGSSPLTTKGDLYGHSTVDARIPVGSDSQVLIADSGQTLGVRWGAVPSGSGGAMTLICSSVSGGANSSFDTNTILGGNIPGSYSHLVLVNYGRLQGAVTNDTIALIFNNDSGANYDACQGQMNAAGTYTGSGNVATTNILIGNLPAATAPAGRYGQIQLFIAGYAQTTGDKSLESKWTLIRGTTTTDVFTGWSSGEWRNTAAITRINISTSGGSLYTSGSAFYLYGIS